LKHNDIFHCPALARSLLNGSQDFSEGSPVVNVTSEVLASAPVQNATARSARQDSSPPAGNDSFASLIDSNAAGRSDNRAQDNSPDTSAPTASQAPAPRRADDAQRPSDSRSRDNTAASDSAASDKAARNDASDRDAAVKSRDDADAGAKTDKPAKSKSDAAKSSDAKSDETKDASTKSSGDVSTADQAGAQQDAVAAVTADAIATAIPVATAPAVTPTVTPATDKAAAPLAIAAAAIAASSAVANAATPAGTDAGTVATASAAKPDGTKTDTHATAGDAVTAQATAADATATAGIALAASTAAKTPGTSKGATQIKTSVTAKEGATTAKPDGTADATATATGDTAALVPVGTPQAPVAGKPKAENGIVDAVKGDASGNPDPAAIAHGHAVTVDASQTLANTPGSGLQGAAAIQAQQPSATSAPAAAQLTVTAATSDAVPLSGVAMEIATSIQSGKSRFEIRLDPADLGRIDVRIDVDRNGQITSHLTVEKPETLSMLRQDAPQLQRALDDAGFKTGGGGLQFSLRDQSSSGQNSGNDNGRNAQRLVISEDDSIPATAIAGRSYGRMLGSSSGVDIRI
jgi:flagellar hook-length control protein FliK